MFFGFQLQKQPEGGSFRRLEPSELVVWVSLEVQPRGSGLQHGDVVTDRGTGHRDVAVACAVNVLCQAPDATCRSRWLSGMDMAWAV